MKGSSVAYAAFSFMFLALTAWTGVVLAPTSMPESVIRSNDDVKHLWREVQEGVLHKWLDPSGTGTDVTWKGFLEQDAEPLIHNYYRKPGRGSVGYKELLTLAKSSKLRNVDFRSFDRDNVSKELAELLVKTFAEKQLAKQVPKPEEEVTSPYRLSPERQQMFQSWGRSLSLHNRGGASEPQASDHEGSSRTPPGSK